MRRHLDEFLVGWGGGSAGRRRCPERESRLPGASGLAVDDGDRLGAGRRAWLGRRRRRLPDRHSGRDPPGRRRPHARPAASGGFGGRRGVQIDRHDDHGFAAEGIISHDRPQHEHAEEERERPGNDLRYRDRIWCGGASSAAGPSGALRSSAVIGRSLAHNRSGESGGRKSCTAVYHGSQRPGRRRPAGAFARSLRQLEAARGIAEPKNSGRLVTAPLALPPPEAAEVRMGCRLNSERRPSGSAGRRHWSSCRAGDRAPS